MLAPNVHPFPARLFLGRPAAFHRQAAAVHRALGDEWELAVELEKHGYGSFEQAPSAPGATR